MIGALCCAKVLQAGTFWPDRVSNLATSEVKGRRPFRLELYGARLQKGRAVAHSGQP